MCEQEPKQRTTFLDYHGTPLRPPTLRQRFGLIGDFLAGATVGLLLSLLVANFGSIYSLLWIVGPIGPATAIINVTPARQGTFLFGGAAILYGFYFMVPQIVRPKWRPVVWMSLAMIHLLSAFGMTSLGR